MKSQQKNGRNDPLKAADPQKVGRTAEGGTFVRAKGWRDGQEVWEARDGRNGEPVLMHQMAIDSGASADAKKAVLEAARAAVPFRHPSILAVREVKPSEGAIVYVQDYPGGQLLNRVITDTGALPCLEALGFLRRFVDGLAKASGAGLLLTQISPEDFALRDSAKDREASRRELVCLCPPVPSGWWLEVDDPAFASPEQKAGKHCDIRSVLYSTGAVFAWIMLGEKPPGGESWENFVNRSGLPRRIKSVLTSVMQAEPEKRCTNAAAWVEMIDHSAEAEPQRPRARASLRLPTLVEQQQINRKANPPKRSPLVLWGGIATVVVVLLAVLVIPRLSKHGDTSPQTAAANQPTPIMVDAPPKESKAKPGPEVATSKPEVAQAPKPELALVPASEPSKPAPTVAAAPTPEVAATDAKPAVKPSSSEAASSEPAPSPSPPPAPAPAPPPTKKPEAPPVLVADNRPPVLHLNVPVADLPLPALAATPPAVSAPEKQPKTPALTAAPPKPEPKAPPSQETAEVPVSRPAVPPAPVTVAEAQFSSITPPSLSHSPPAEALPIPPPPPPAAAPSKPSPSVESAPPKPSTPAPVVASTPVSPASPSVASPSSPPTSVAKSSTEDLLKQAQKAPVEEREKLYRSVLENDPNNREALRGLVQDYSADLPSGAKLEEFRGWAQNLSQSNDPIGHLGLGVAELEQGETVETLTGATTHLQTALQAGQTEAFPFLLDGYIRLNLAQQQAGKKADSPKTRVALYKVLDTMPADVPAEVPRLLAQKWEQNLKTRRGHAGGQDNVLRYQIYRLYQASANHGDPIARKWVKDHL